MTRNSICSIIALAVVGLLGYGAATRDEPALANAGQPAGAREEPPKNYSPYANRDYPTRVYWGETHLHTSFSPDAGLVGDRVSPDDAFHLARGEQIRSSTQQPIQLVRPYDWLCISDHATYFGLPQAFADNDPGILKTEVGKKWAEAFKKGGQAGYDAFVEMTKEFAVAKGSIPKEARDKLNRTVWDRAIAAAERNNKPGVFTALNGFEWTQTVKGNNLHRTVVFRDGPDRTKKVIPFSEFDSADPEDLWKYMADYEEKNGGRVLAIEHNPNLSCGQMFAPTTFNGKPFDKKYAEMRARFDRLAEASQCKGDSETTPQLSPNDQFADFDVRWNKANIFGLIATRPEMLPYNYCRSALKLGLEHQAKLGANPFKFGFIGASDQHTSLSTTRAENYFGMGTIAEPKPDRWKELFMRSEVSPDLNMYMWECLPGGMTGVWAKENTREGIFDALYRKEVYCTSGTRPSVRVFGGWDFTAKELDDPDPVWVKNGYARGVPMGGDLSHSPAGKAPALMIKAAYDPDGAYLDRVQIIKGWLDGKGVTHEKVIDVAWSGDRKPDPKSGIVPPVGSTVDVKNATWTNSIGAPLLTAFWRDPDFEPNQRAFYYVRVIEIPTPRWTAYDCKRFGIKMDSQVPMTVTNRAYSSPIWHDPDTK